jgi:large subunit ribosomal protein L34e
MQRRHRTRAVKKTKRRLPGGKTVVHFKKKKVAHHKCGKCKAKLNRARLRAVKVRKLTKVQRRPSRPLPHLCPKCMREEIRTKVRGAFA